MRTICMWNNIRQISSKSKYWRSRKPKKKKKLKSTVTINKVTTVVKVIF